MPFCESCGYQISEQTRFCRNCGQEVIQPLTQSASNQQYLQPHSTKIKPKSKIPIIITIVVIVMVVITFILLLVILPESEKNNDNIKKSITFKEFANDYINYNFKSFEPDDKVIVKDKIRYIVYEFHEVYERRVTSIWFESTHYNHSIDELQEHINKMENEEDLKYASDLIFEGNLTVNYKAGDEVIITLHIIDVDLEGIKGEFIEELWGELGVWDEPQTLPSSCIKHT